MRQLRSADNRFAVSAGVPRFAFPRPEGMREERMGFSIDLKQAGEAEGESLTLSKALKIAIRTVRKGDSPVVQVGGMIFHSKSVFLFGMERELLGLIVARSSANEMFGIALEVLDNTPQEHLAGSLGVMLDCLGSVQRYATSDKSRRIIGDLVREKTRMLRKRYGQ